MLRTGPLAAAACAGMFLFGIVMALLGAILPLLSERLRFDLSEAGLLFLAMNACMLAASLLLGPAMDRTGLKIPLILGPLLAGAALSLIGQAPHFGRLLEGVALLGIGGAALNSGTNTLMADLYDDPRRKNSALNLLGVFFGFGALVLPFAIGSLLGRAGLPPILLAVAVACVAASLYTLALPFPPPKQRAGAPAGGLVRLARTPRVLLTGVFLFFQSGNEFILGGYLSTFLTREAGASVVSASYVLALFWAAIMLTRAVWSRVLLRANALRLIQLSAAASAIATALLIATGSGLAAVLVGVCAAGIYPTVLGVTGAEYKDRSGAVFGILFTLALAGGMLLPWITGRFAAAAGLRAALWIVVAGFAVELLLSLRIAHARS
jgi:fucose permease